MPAPTDPLDALLDRWSEPPSPSPHLADDVWRRLAHAEDTQLAPEPASARTRPHFAPWLLHPATAAGALAACLLLAFLVIEWQAARRHQEQRAQLARSYLELIDPLVSASDSPDEVESQLAWLQRELGLSDEQFTQIKALHAASGPRLRALAQEVTRLRTELALFEEARRTTERVDFLAFARVVEARHDVDRACLDSTRQLVEATAGVMTPAQRVQYLGLLNPAEPKLN